MIVYNGSSNKTTCMYVRLYVLLSVVTGIVYRCTCVTNPLHACFPELLSNIRDAIIMILLLALYHFTLSMWLPAQTIYSNCSKNLLPLHP